jgi:uncharacterized repeat protein (TIGR02543 family)
LVKVNIKQLKVLTFFGLYVKMYEIRYILLIHNKKRSFNMTIMTKSINLKKVTALLLMVALLLTITSPNLVSAATTYVDAGGNLQTHTGDITEYTNQTTLSAGWYIVTGERSVPSRITVNGDVHIILSDNSHLNVNGGIRVEDENRLTIYAQSGGEAMGRLTASNPGNDNAGIGGNSGQMCGVVTINGGVIDSTGGTGGAGIGSGAVILTPPTISLSPTTFTFAAVSAGYTPGSRPAAQEFTVTSGNSTATGAMTVALSGTGASAFTLSVASLDSITTSGGTRTFTIRPNAGLNEGTYTATVTVSGLGLATPQTATVSFTVMPIVATGHAVTFNVNFTGGTNPPNGTTGADGRLNAMPTPTRSGHVFSGWWSAATGGTRMELNRVYSADTTLFARWTTIDSGRFIITFDGNGGTVFQPQMQTELATVNGQQINRLAVLPTTPIRGGHIFVGWYTTTTTTSTANMLRENRNHTANTTYFARWQPIRVRFNLNGGTLPAGSTTNPVNVNASNRLETLPTPTRAGHTFAGWYTSQVGGALVDTSRVYSSTVTLFARWTPNTGTTYTITLNVNGGTAITPNTRTTEANLRLTAANLPTPTRSGHVFAGWFNRGTGEQVTTETVFSANTEIHARWTVVEVNAANSRVITLNPNGGTVTETTRRTDGHGYLMLPLPTPKREGFVFTGWFTAQTGGTRVLSGAYGNQFPSSTTIYARWTPLVARSVDDTPAHMRENFDWFKDARHVHEPVIFNRNNLIFDQIWAGNGTINFAVRWDSNVTMTYEQRRLIQVMLHEEVNRWTRPLIGFEDWPFDEIQVTVVGWAVRNINIIQDRRPNERVWVNNVRRAPFGGSNIPGNEGELQPSLPSNMSRFENFNNVNSGTHLYPGGLHNRFDMYLWGTSNQSGTSGMGGGAGGDWGTRMGCTTARNAAQANPPGAMVLSHEIGHGFGLYDFYGITGIDRPYPTSGGVSFNSGTPTTDGLRSVMVVGGQTSVPSVYDEWKIRYYWNWVKQDGAATRFRTSLQPIGTDLTSPQTPTPSGTPSLSVTPMLSSTGTTSDTEMTTRFYIEDEDTVTSFALPESANASILSDDFNGITINGGTVTATGGNGGAGIGGGRNGDGVDVVITGGTVNAAGGDTASSIGAGVGSANNGTLTDGNGNNVFLNTLTVTGQNNALVTNALFGLSGAYGTFGVRTNASGQLFFYLRSSGGENEDAFIVIDGTTYTANYRRRQNHTNTATFTAVECGHENRQQEDCSKCDDCDETDLTPTCTEPDTCPAHTTNPCDVGHDAGPNATCTTSQNCVRSDCNHEIAPPFGHLPDMINNCTQCTRNNCNDVLPQTCSEPDLCAYHEVMIDPCEDGHDNSGAEAACMTPQICARADCTYEINPPLGHQPDMTDNCTQCTRDNCTAVLDKSCLDEEPCAAHTIGDECEDGHDSSGSAATCTTPQICARDDCSYQITAPLGHQPNMTDNCTQCMRNGCTAVLPQTCHEGNKGSLCTHHIPIVTRLLGDVNGDGDITILDALEVLKFLAGIKNNAISDDGGEGSDAWNAAIIHPPLSEGQRRPAIGDVLEILKKLAKLSNKIDNPD